MVFGGQRKVYVQVRSLVGWQEEQRTVQQGFCPAVSLCGVTVHHAFGDHGMVKLDVG